MADITWTIRGITVTTLDNATFLEAASEEVLSGIIASVQAGSDADVVIDSLQGE